MSSRLSPNHEHSDEHSPLISPDRSPTERVERSSKKPTPWLSLALYLLGLIAIIDVGFYLLEPPKTRMYEAKICFRHYQKYDPSKIKQDGTVDESLCKINAVQEKLAAIMGWEELFESLPAILLAVPFGAWADKYGRKWIFVSSFVGMLLNCSWKFLISQTIWYLNAEPHTNCCRLFSHPPTPSGMAVFQLLSDRWRPARCKCHWHNHDI
jgi:hypothetical protein